MTCLNSVGRLFYARPARLAIVIASLGLGACASLPDDGELSSLPDAGQFQSTSIKGTSTQWPQDNWWKRYNDAQLNQLIEEALTSAPDMKMADARLQSAAAVIGLNKAALGPNVSANASVTREKQSYNYLTPESMTPNGLQNYGRTTIDASWELDFWGKNRANLAAATSAMEATQAERAAARLTLSAGIASSWAELAHLYASRDTLEHALEIRSTTARLMKERFDNGLETRGSLRRAEALQASAQGDVLAIDEQIELQRHAIAALLGAGPDRAASLQRPVMSLAGDTAVPSDLPLSLLGRRPDIVAARLQAESRMDKIDASKAAFYPDVNLSAMVGLQSLGLDKLTDGGSTIGSFGPAISLPIFNGGSLRSNLRQARAGYEEAVASYQSAISHALNEVADAATSQRALQGRMQASQQALEAAEESWRISRNRYEGGLDSYLDVLTAEDLVIQNRRALTDLQARAITLDVALVQALGGGYQQPVSE